MNTNDNRTNNAGAVASAIGGAAIAGSLTTIGTGAGIVAAPVIGIPLAVVFGAGYLASSAWDLLFD